MARHIPFVRNGTLFEDSEQVASLNAIVVESSDWYAWLEGHDSFRFADATGSFTARKEQRSGNWYWYAYRRQARRLYTAYLGRSVELSVTRLEVIAAELAGDDGLRTPRVAESERISGLPASHAPRQANVTTSGSLLLYNLGQLTSLIGREQEVITAGALLRRPEVRLLSLVGTAGVGKTRLAIQVASDLFDDFPDGVFFVALAPVRNPDLVLSMVVQTLGLRVTGDQTFRDALKFSLREKHCILVLDNFEQVVNAAPLLTDLLEDCSHVKLLVTSREVLHLRAEHQFSVPPLALPDRRRLPDEQTLARIAAVELFLQRAQSIRSDFHLTPDNAAAIAEICIHLDGLPLALELAAVRVKVFTPQAMLTRLDRRLQILTGGARDLPERQRTLRGTIEWSYELLSVEEQRVFRRLCVFAGGTTLEAIEAVTTALGDDPAGVLDGIASLIDKSLLPPVRQEEGLRFAMLETIREYGLERLAASGEVELTRQRHAEYFVQYAEEAAREVDGPQQAAWFDRLELEHENMRNVLRWSLELGTAEETEYRLTIAIRLAGALRKFWVVRGHMAEGLSFLERVLARSEGSISMAQRARVVDQAGGLALFSGALARAEALLQESLHVRRALADTRGIAAVLNRLGALAMDQGNLPAALSYTEEALALFNERGDLIRIPGALSQLAIIACEQGHYDKAYAMFEECLARYREQGNTIEVGNSLCQLGEILLLSGGSLEQAQVFFDQGLAFLREVGDDVSYPLALVGHVALLRGDLFTAQLQSAESISQARRINAPHNLARVLVLSGRVQTVQGNLTGARTCYLESLTIAVQRRFKGVSAAGVEGLAQVLAMQKAFVWAVRLWGAAEALREAAGTPLPPVYRHEYEQAVAVAHMQLGKQSFLTAWTEGRLMIPEQILLSMESMPAPPPALLPLSLTASAPLPHADLTPRELGVLRLLAQGLTSAQMAERLVIGLVTVNSHVRSIYSKLGVTSRAAATRYAIEHQLV